MGMHRVARVVALLVFFTLALTLTRFNRRQYLPSPFRSPEGGFGKESDPQQVLTATAEPSKSATQGELSSKINPTASCVQTAAPSLAPVQPGKSEAQALLSTDYASGNAYVFYAAQDEYACSVLVNIHRLQHKFQTKYPIYVLATRNISPAYLNAFEEANVTVSIQNSPPLHPQSTGIGYYQDCLLKLFSFKMHQLFPSIKRVLALDADQLIVQNLDHVFSTPKVDLAAPRAYWIAKDFISSTFMLISLSDGLWNVVDNAIRHVRQDQYDMDIVNDLFQDTVLMLPGSYVSMNAHWEDRTLPTWFRPDAKKSSEKKEEQHSLVHQKRDTPNNRNSSTSTPETLERPFPTQVPDDSIHDTPKAQYDISGSKAIVESQPPSDHDENNSKTPSLSSTDVESIEDNLAQSNQNEQELEAPPSTEKQEKQVQQKPGIASVSQDVDLDAALESLYKAVHVLHYTSLGKPWTYKLTDVRTNRPDAHPIFLQQWRTWREAAKEICPSTEYLLDSGARVQNAVVSEL